MQKRDESLQDLANRIASLPQNHDELEILIADMIKRHIHQEKYHVYHGLHGFFKGFGDAKPIEHMRLKMEGHKALKDKWEYGTENSVIHAGGWK